MKKVKDENSSQNVVKKEEGNKVDREAQISVEQHNDAVENIETTVGVFANSGSLLVNGRFTDSSVTKGKIVYDLMSCNVKEEPL